MSHRCQAAGIDANAGVTPAAHTELYDRGSRYAMQMTSVPRTGSVVTFGQQSRARAGLPGRQGQAHLVPSDCSFFQHFEMKRARTAFQGVMDRRDSMTELRL